MIKYYSNLVYWSVVTGCLIVGFSIGTNFGCELQQLERMDRIVSDANDLVAAGGAMLGSPAGALIPPDIRLYGAAGLAIASVVLNSWQKIRGNLMKKTTKAIVRGIEIADKPRSNPMSAVKSSIKTEMELAGVYDRGNRLIDRIKVLG